MNVDICFTSKYAASLYDNKAPEFATPGSCALDLRSAYPTDVSIRPGEQFLIPTGIRVAPKPGPFPGPIQIKVASLILPRSGRGIKEGLVLANTVGLIDEDYRGELLVSVWCRPGAPNDLLIAPGERIAQLCFVPVFDVQFNLRHESQFMKENSSDRGEGGLGSTGQ